MDNSQVIPNKQGRWRGRFRGVDSAWDSFGFYGFCTLGEGLLVLISPELYVTKFPGRLRKRIEPAMVRIWISYSSRLRRAVAD